MRGRRRRRRDAGGSRRVRVDAGGPAGSPRGAAQAARRAHDTHARDGRAGAIHSWLFVFSQVLPTRPYRALSRLCATSPPRTCSRRPRWTQPRANTPVGSASGRCSSRYCGGCTRRSWTRSLYLRQGEVYTLLCFSFVFVLDVVSMRCPLSSPCFVTYPDNPAKRRETGRCKEKQKHTTLHPATSSVTRPYPPEDIEAGAGRARALVTRAADPPRRPRRVRSDNATNTWLKLSRPGDDGDTCYLGFADTTLLDFVSRGLDARELEDKRVGDFDPSHRIAVFTEPESESSSKTNGHGDSSDEDDDSYVPDMRPRWVSVVSQLDVLDLMVQDPDLLGTFPRTATMESLGLTRGVFSVAAVTSDFSVAGCFALMHNLKVSGVAVLDRHGRFMIGSISASDVRRVTCANDLADALMSTVGEFLRDRVWSKIPGRENQRHARPILIGSIHDT